MVAIDEVEEEDEADDGGDDADEPEEEDEGDCAHFGAAEGEGFEDEEWDGHD